MKRILVILLTISVLLSFPVNANASEKFSTGFEESDTMELSLKGNAKYVFDSDKNSKVLYLDGSNNTYAEFPSGTFDSMDTATVLFDIKPVSKSGNYFTFAIGTDDQKYSFFRIRGSEIRNAITVNSYTSERETRAALDYSDSWLSVAIVFNGASNKLYVNGKLKSENNDTGIKLSDLGDSLLAYLGKSFYSGDSYYQGYFDNVKVFDSALDDSKIKSYVSDAIPLLYKATLGSVLDNVNDSVGTDNHTAVYANIDRKNGVINSYVKSSQSLSAVPFNLSLGFSDCKVYIDEEEISLPCTLDLTSEKALRIIKGEREEDYTINTPSVAKNPVLNGQYADPDIDIFDGRFWIYPTTDGVAGWGGTQFHAFSSLDLVNWIDEGVILDVKEKTSKKNARGINIAVSKWSDINAWAPAVEEKNGKYYFYYCSNISAEYTSVYGNGMAIGVAWASSPNGPFTALDKPLVYPKLLSDSSIGFYGQAIDPAIFTDDDGSSYILFGNGMAAVAKLGSNMTSLDSSSLRLIEGLNEFRESVAVFKRNNTYYFTWSCDDTGSENYHINWGYSTSLDGNIINKGTLLCKNDSIDILGTGHQSVIYIPENDKCFIAYHRFYTPLGQVDGGYGFHRETCIDEVTFKKKILTPDEMNTVKPSYEGTGAFDVKGNGISEIIPTHYTPKAPTPTPAPTKKITVKKTAITKLKRGKKKFTVKYKKIKSVSGYQIQYSTSKKFTKKTTKTKKTKKTSLTVKKLKAKKKYYIRIRAYKKSGKKTYYANWSKTKAVKTK